MSKESIEWHEQGLRNSQTFCKRLEAELKAEIESKQAQINRLREGISFYEFQIESAKKENKQEFDRDRYKVKRKNIKEKNNEN